MNHEFQGVRFLHQFFQQRNRILAVLLADLGAPPNLSQLYANLDTETDFHEADMDPEQTIEKIQKILKIQLFRHADLDLLSKERLDFLARKFEANGRLSPSFDKNSGRGVRGEIDLQAYALFAVSVCHELNSHFDYSRLSTLMKLNDLLSVRLGYSHTSALTKQCLYYTVETELRLLGHVMDSKVIPYARD
jgi:hypothetical protein